MNRRRVLSLACLLGISVGVITESFSAPKKVVERPPLTSEGEQAYSEYSKMLASLRGNLKGRISQINPEKKAQFLKAFEAEKGTIKKSKDKNGKVREEIRNNTYNNAKATFASLIAAHPILSDLDGVLSSDALDSQLVKCAVLASATPRGLAEFAQQGTEQKGLVDGLLADTQLMKEMLYAGGAKAGRYGKALQIFGSILAASNRAGKGHFRRLALGTSLELAAPELCGYVGIDPVQRYQFFEKSYLCKELDPAFDKLTTWQYRQVINDPHTEADMAWMREMLWNYRPDQITAPKGYKAHYVGLMNSEFGHKQAEIDENAPETRMQQIIDKGGQCEKVH